tara:strand:- start:2563 stop:3552 length:990 start_codon:yes stop_codon:yes gene_type:complete
MSEEAAKTTSEEDKFFGVKTTFEKGKPVTNNEVELEVVDDRPEADRRPPESEAAKAGSDEELENYGENVQKRIKKLTYKQHEERRKREEAERMREEAIKVAQQYAAQNQQFQQVISQGERFIHEQAQQRALAMFEKAKQEYRQAYEEGNTDKVVQAQEEMMSAKQEATAAQWNAQSVRQPQPQQRRPQQQRPQQQRQAAPKPAAPSPKAQEWAANNQWFGKQKDMTALAYGVHETLVTEQGMEPDSDEYYEAIDRTMRTKFPEHFGAEESGSDYTSSSTRQSPPVVTAPSTRNNGAKPRKVRLNRTQIALAKRLGITPEQYANQLLKES